MSWIFLTHYLVLHSFQLHRQMVTWCYMSTTFSRQVNIYSSWSISKLYVFISKENQLWKWEIYVWMNDWNNLTVFSFDICLCSRKLPWFGSPTDKIYVPCQGIELRNPAKCIYDGCPKSRLLVSLPSTVKYDKCFAYYLISFKKLVSYLYSCINVLDTHRSFSIDRSAFLSWPVFNWWEWFAKHHQMEVAAMVKLKNTIVRGRCFPAAGGCKFNMELQTESFRWVTVTTWMPFFSVDIICFISECHLKALLKCYTCTALLTILEV